MHIKRTDVRIVPQHVNNFSFQQICNFTYLGSVMSENNFMQSEIAERISKVNRACNANLEHVTSKLLNSTKMKNYLTLIRPVVSYVTYSTCSYMCL
jgi:hypothetical protein